MTETSLIRYKTILVSFLARQIFRLKDPSSAFLHIGGDGPRPSDTFFETCPEFHVYRAQPSSWWQKQIDQIKNFEDKGLRFLLPQDRDFPVPLRQLQDPPLCLTTRGDLDSLKLMSLSVVGAREMSTETDRWLDEHLGACLNVAPLTVVSGAARGVDQKSHFLALRAGRPTVAVLPSGLGQVYPASFEPWTHEILENGGCLVSEFHPRIPMRKWNFALRNRLLIGLSPVVLVVQAKVKSGSWTSARLALDEGRQVGVVPGAPWDPRYSGSLELLQDGAPMIRRAADLIALYRSCHSEAPQATVDLV